VHSQPESILTIVIPVYNEASVLEKTIQTIVPYATEKGWELIFVDDGSTDHSNQILAQLVTVPPVRVLRHKINRGYGAALKTGISCVQTPYVVTFDADGQHQIQDVERILNFAIQNDSDLVVGQSTRNREQKSVPSAGKVDHLAVCALAYAAKSKGPKFRL
jgi:glycosyltransferase involved in cell wall biosynthesis